MIAELIDHVRAGLRAEGWSGRCRSGGGARGSAKHSSASGRSQIRSYSYGSGARRFELGALPSSRPRLVVAMVFSDASPIVLESCPTPKTGGALLKSSGGKRCALIRCDLPEGGPFLLGLEVVRWKHWRAAKLLAERAHARRCPTNWAALGPPFRRIRPGRPCLQRLRRRPQTTGPASSSRSCSRSSCSASRCLASWSAWWCRRARATCSTASARRCGSPTSAASSSWRAPRATPPASCSSGSRGAARGVARGTGGTLRTSARWVEEIKTYAYAHA